LIENCLPLRQVRPPRRRQRPTGRTCRELFFRSVSSDVETDVGFAQAPAATWAGFKGPFWSACRMPVMTLAALGSSTRCRTFTAYGRRPRVVEAALARQRHQCVVERRNLAVQPLQLRGYVFVGGSGVM
jgi:hypothetical protein